MKPSGAAAPEGFIGSKRKLLGVGVCRLSSFNPQTRLERQSIRQFGVQLEEKRGSIKPKITEKICGCEGVLPLQCFIATERVKIFTRSVAMKH